MDVIGDMLTIIRNGYLARKKTVLVPYSSVKNELAKILMEEGYLEQVHEAEEKTKKSKRKMLSLVLRYLDNEPVLSGIKRVSKPGRRIYKGKEDFRKVFGGYGITIVTTSQGLMTAKKAKEKGLGGEVFCVVW